MSWGGLPFWVYDLGYEQHLAECSCAFKDEWFSGTSKVMPKHAIFVSKADFKAWEKGGWYYNEKS